MTKIGNTEQNQIILYAKWTKVSVKRTEISSVKVLKSQRLRVKVKKKEQVSGYEYVYATTAMFSRKCLVRSRKNPKDLSKLKKGKVYYIKVRTYKLDSYGKKVYGKYSKVVRCKMKK